MRIIKQDILDITQGIIVHQVNLQGVMGAGLARDIREKYPIVYSEYKAAIRDGTLRLGDVQLIQINDRLWVANMVGQDGYGRDKAHTNVLAMLTAFPHLDSFAREKNLIVYLPFKIGCGLGGGSWTKVSQVINEYLPNALVCRKG